MFQKQQSNYEYIIDKKKNRTQKNKFWKIPNKMLRIHNLKQTKSYLKDLVAIQQPSKQSIHCEQTQNNWLYQNTLKTFNQNSIIYDDFIYTDKLTNKKIKMRDAKTSYEKGRNYRNSTTLQLANLTLMEEKKKRQSRVVTRQHSRNDLQKQLTDLNECFIMLKSTEMFKMNSLREKIFKSGQKSEHEIVNNRKLNKSQTQNENVQKDLKDLLMKKKKIRQMLEESVKQANLQQFRKCFKNQNYKINPKIIQMSRQIPRSFNKTNIEKIISTMKSSDKNDETSCPKFIKKVEEDIEFPGEEKLKSDGIGYMKKQMRQNGEYLIVPQKKKLLFQKLYKNVNSKTGNSVSQNSYHQYTEGKSIYNEINNSHDQSTFGSRIVINIPSEQTLPQTFENNKQSRVNLRSIAKTQALQTKQNEKVVKPYSNLHPSFSEDKQNSKPSQLGSFLKQFYFSPSSKNGEISKIKKKFQNNQKLCSKRLNMKEQRFLFLVENGLLFDVEKQILMSEEYLFLKDKNEDNLLHLCAKNHSTEMFFFIVQRLKKCEGKRQRTQKWGKQLLRDRLLEKNKNNKNVFQVARVYHAEEILENLLKIKEQLNIKDYEL